MKIVIPSWCAVLAVMTFDAGCKPRSGPSDAVGASSHAMPSAAPSPASPARSGTATAEASSLLPCRWDKDNPEPAKPAAPGPRHTWGTITDPALNTPWGLDGKAHPTIRIAEENRGLRVDLSSVATLVTGNQTTNRVVLLRFDLTPIPAGAIITSADVTVTAARSSRSPRRRSQRRMRSSTRGDVRDVGTRGRGAFAKHGGAGGIRAEEPIGARGSSTS